MTGGLFGISRYSRFLSLKNIFDSTLPLKLLKETLSSLRLTNLEIDNGRGPCSLLLLNQEQPMSYAGIHQYAQSVGYYNSYINIRVVVMIKKKKKKPLLCRIGVKSLIEF